VEVIRPGWGLGERREPHLFTGAGEDSDSEKGEGKRMATAGAVGSRQISRPRL